jgi:lysophospholipase L1-like esterase
MKKFIAFTLIIFAFTMVCIYFTEKTDVLQLTDRPIIASFTDRDGHTIFSWKRLPYPCFYKVETFSKTTEMLADEPEYHFFRQDFTFKASYEVPPTAIPMYYRITAYGMFGKISGPSKMIPNPNYADPLAPVHISKYTQTAPASTMPYLIWHSVPAAVCYEVELLSATPENESGTELSTQYHLFSTQQVFTNGWQADLRSFANEHTLFWRVRAMDLQKKPIGVFSKAEPIHIDPQKNVPTKPLLNNYDQMPDFKQPLYPVYHWIPMHDISRYEVELLTSPPVMENNTEPSQNRAWYKVADDSFSCYDEYARPYAGEYYWRVRAVDSSGNTIGTYSDTEKFTVEAHKDRVLTAAFGDSITHGGGSVSYSPANLEYSYMTYLDFPVLNLGKSGDIAHTTLLRFDSDVLPFRPYNLLILTGSNSLRDESTSAQEIITDLDALKRKCEENDIRPIFLTLMPLQPANIYAAFQTETDPHWQSKMVEVNAHIRQQAYYIDLEPYFYDANKQFLPTALAIDGLHPSIPGKMLMAEIINQQQELLRKQP